MAGLFVFVSTSPTTEGHFRGLGRHRSGSARVAGVLDDALSTVFDLAAFGRPDAPTPAYTPWGAGRPCRRAVNRCATARVSPHGPTRSKRVPSARHLARFLPPCLGCSTSAAEHRVSMPGSSGAAVGTIHGAVRRRTAGTFVTAWPRQLDIDAMAAAARDLLGWRLREVPPPPRSRHHHPRSAETGLVTRGRPGSPRMSPRTHSAGRWCGRWLAHGPSVAGPPRTRLVRHAIEGDEPVQWFAAAPPQVCTLVGGRASRPAPRSAGDRLDPAGRQSAAWPDHLADAYIQAGMANQAADFVAARSSRPRRRSRVTFVRASSSVVGRIIHADKRQTVRRRGGELAGSLCRRQKCGAPTGFAAMLADRKQGSDQ